MELRKILDIEMKRLGGKSALSKGSEQGVLKP